MSLYSYNPVTIDKVIKIDEINFIIKLSISLSFKTIKINKGIVSSMSGADNDFSIMNRKQFLDTRQQATEIFTYLLAGIAAVSLLVGGIGIMNIMLVTVTERTREIGIRKAMGATNGNIMLQFLVEAMTLCLLGGGIGLALGIGAAYIASEFAGWQTQVSFVSVITAFTFSAAVGLVFGMWPAKRASGLDPIDALRHE